MAVKVTLSFPFYKSEKFVARAFDCAINQNYENLEILIINNGSKDRSSIILDTLIKTYHGDKIIRMINVENNIGLGHARNIAIDEAKGEFIFFMDSDDTIPQNCIKTLVEVAAQYNPQVVCGAYNKVNEMSDIIKTVYPQYILLSSNEVIMREFFIHHTLPLPIWNKLYKIDFLRANAIRCNPVHINEDMLFSIQVYLLADNIAFSGIPTYNYFIYEGSANEANKDTWSVRYLNQIQDVVKEYKSYLINLSDETQHEIFSFWMCRYFFYLSAKILRSADLDDQERKKLVREILTLPSLPKRYLITSIKTQGFIWYLLGQLPFSVKYHMIRVYNLLK